MIEKSDWRLQGQENFLLDVELCHDKYKPYRIGWDHDHCEFCGKKFSLLQGDMQEGFRTLDKYHWICKQCYDDFVILFNWSVSIC